MQVCCSIGDLLALDPDRPFPQTIVVTAGICIAKAINRPLAALGRQPPVLLVDIKSPAIPFDTPLTGMPQTSQE